MLFGSGVPNNAKGDSELSDERSRWRGDIVESVSERSCGVILKVKLSQGLMSRVEGSF